MASFNGFTDAQMDRISQKLGYTGPKHKFSEFLASNPAANRAYSGLLNKVNMKFNVGGSVPAAPTAKDYEAFAKSLQGLGSYEQKQAVDKARADLQARGIAVDPALEAKYVTPAIAPTAFDALQNMKSGGSQADTMNMLRRSTGEPTTFTPEQYQSYGESLKGMDPFSIKKKVDEDRARLEAQGYTLPSDVINQYLDPIAQASIKEYGQKYSGVNTGPTLTGNVPNLVVGSDPSGVTMTSGPQPGVTLDTSGMSPQTGPTLGGDTPTLDLTKTGAPGIVTGADTTGVTLPISPLTPEQQKNIRDYAQRSANTFEAGVSPQEIQQQYAKDLLALPEGMRAEAEKIFAEELEANRPGVLEQFRQAIATPPPPAPVEPPVGPSAEMPEGFNAQEYLEMYPDVAQAGIDPLQHYLMYGQSEGRSINKANFLKPELYDAYMQNMSSMVASGSMTAEDAFSQMLAEVNRLRGEGYTVDEAELSRSLNAAFSGNTTPESIKEFIDTGGAGADAGADAGAGGVSIQDTMIQRAMQPALPVGGKTVAEGIGFDQATQQIGAGTGQVGAAPTVSPATTATTAQATTPGQLTAQQYDAAMASGQMPPTAPAVGTVSAPMMAQTQVPSSTEVAQQQAAQLDQAVRVEAPAARQLSAQELVEAPADAQAAAAFAEQVQAAQAQPTPEATVQGQLTNLMAQFEDGQTPPWAAGAMRQATAIMAQRGLGASSMAGQAVIQAAMESALPIATQDAQTMAQFEMQNLSNRQARAMLAAQQRATFIGQEFDQQFQARVQNASRVADIANLNFSAEQQIALENAQLAQTVDLNNLSNRQAVQMANIAQIANLETTNLNNRQQAAVQNAQNFLQMDMANLSNEQQAVMFDAQSRLQTILSDQAADNASRQFNATSQNQVDQFFANLSSQVSQFNATQSNAMEQFNIEQESAINQFNAELKNQRDQFNAQNQLIVAQSNAQWRRDIATADTAALNQANQLNAQAILGISEQAYANLWQAYEDEMEYAWQGGQNELDRINKLAQQRILADADLTAAQATADATTSSALGTFAATALFGVPGAGGYKGIIAGLGG